MIPALLSLGCIRMAHGRGRWRGSASERKARAYLCIPRKGKLCFSTRNTLTAAWITLQCMLDVLFWLVRSGLRICGSGTGLKLEKPREKHRQSLTLQCSSLSLEYPRRFVGSIGFQSMILRSTLVLLTPNSQNIKAIHSTHTRSHFMWRVSTMRHGMMAQALGLLVR